MWIPKPAVYLRVGPDGSHAQFIQDVSEKCKLKLFNRRCRTPRSMFHGRSTKINENYKKTIGRCKEPKMVAFNNISVKHMCTSWPFKCLDGWMQHELQNIDTWIFSVNDKGMKSCGEIDAQDILLHVFGSDDLKGRISMLYQNITEIHHMLPDGTVRILSCDSNKLQDAIVLTYSECMERVRVGAKGVYHNE
jgi:hypothetical protein